MTFVKPSDTVTVQFTVTDPGTGAATDADSLPAGTLIRNGADTGETVTIQNVTTGVYSAAVTIPAGYSAGDEVQIRIAATVGGVAGQGVVWGAQVDTLRVSDISASVFPAGAIEFTYTVTRSDNGNPIEGVDVWISTDVAGTNIIWRGTTDALGVARDVNNNKPMLDAGTYQFWRQLGGFTFTNPDEEVVS